MTAERTYRDTARLSGVPFARLAAGISAVAAARGLTVDQSDPAAMTCTTPFGMFRIADEGARIRLDVAAAQEANLHTLKEGLVENLTRSMPAVADTLEWSGAGRADERPPNFRLATVEEVSPLGRDFIRVRLRGENLDLFTGERLHFRLVLPPEGDPDPVWPHLDPQGRTIWPTGDKALHRPVYTTAAFDAEAGTLDFDVFLHEGGRVTEWASRVSLGTRIGLIGPSGGSLAQAPEMLIAGDETGFPAIARILADLPPNVTGHLILQSEDGVVDYPMPELPTGLQVRHLSRRSGDSLVDLLRDIGPPAAQGFIWVACEKSDCQHLRAHFREGLGWGPDRSYIAGFWTR